VKSVVSNSVRRAEGTAVNVSEQLLEKKARSAAGTYSGLWKVCAAVLAELCSASVRSCRFPTTISPPRDPNMYALKQLKPSMSGEKLQLLKLNML
jgi:hypothetical protein